MWIGDGPITPTNLKRKEIMKKQGMRHKSNRTARILILSKTHYYDKANIQTKMGKRKEYALKMSII